MTWERAIDLNPEKWDQQKMVQWHKDRTNQGNGTWHFLMVKNFPKDPIPKQHLTQILMLFYAFSIKWEIRHKRVQITQKTRMDQSKTIMTMAHQCGQLRMLHYFNKYLLLLFQAPCKDLEILQCIKPKIISEILT